MNGIVPGASASMRAAYSRLLESLGARPEVTGVDIGHKYVDGVRTRDLVVRVHVRRKMPKSRLADGERVPASVLGIETDVLEARYESHSTGTPRPWERHSTVQPGISVGSAKAEAGTLGLIVYDAETGAPCMLSAFHVLAGPFGAIEDPITQPARIDQGRAPADTVATLLRFHRPGSWGDAAVAKLNGQRPFAAEQLGSAARLTGLGPPTIDQVLEKCGRTTGVTRGRVEGTGTYYYAHAPYGIGGFRLSSDGFDDPERQDLSAVGDSGAVWYDPATGVGVGLHCAGESGSDREFAIASYLSRVMKTLQVSLQPPEPQAQA
jgi:hypothetical protein